MTEVSDLPIDRLRLCSKYCTLFFDKLGCSLYVKDSEISLSWPAFSQLQHQHLWSESGRGCELANQSQEATAPRPTRVGELTRSGRSLELLQSEARLCVEELWQSYISINRARRYMVARNFSLILRDREAYPRSLKPWRSVH